VACLLALGAACGDERLPPKPPEPKPPPESPARIVIEGDARFDGEPFDAEFVGAVVLHDGLATPCQAALPPVEDGRYTIPVHGADAAAGCGTAGSRVVLWAFTHDRIHFSTNTLDWPEDGATTATFDPAFSSSAPQGASPAVAQFSGTVFDADGEVLPTGTVVEAFVGDVRCGVASVRPSDSFLGYVISIVGPESAPGCTRGLAITFRVDGELAEHNPVVNTPPGEREAIDLRVPG
jgi:hypothetical protein